jgi:hypothetical protein
MRKLGKKMFETVVVGSMENERQNVLDIAPETEEDANTLIQEEEKRLNIVAIEPEADAEIEFEENERRDEPRREAGESEPEEWQ